MAKLGGAVDEDGRHAFWIRCSLKKVFARFPGTYKRTVYSNVVVCQKSAISQFLLIKHNFCLLSTKHRRSLMQRLNFERHAIASQFLVGIAHLD